MAQVGRVRVDWRDTALDIRPSRGEGHGMEPTTELGVFVQLRMKILGLTPTELMDVSGISRATIYRLLSEDTPSIVDTAQLHRLATALQVDALELARVWHGIGGETRQDPDDERDRVLRAFRQTTDGLTAVELRAVVDVALAVIPLAKVRAD